MYKLLYAVFIFKEVKSANESIQWGNDCPRVCNCKNTDFKDLPIVKWMYNEVKSEVEPNSTQNEVKQFYYLQKLKLFTQNIYNNQKGSRRK